MKSFITLSISMILSLSAFAQKENIDVKHFSLGIHAGLNMAKEEDFIYPYQQDFKSGLNAGITCNYSFSNLIHLQGEINYIQKGCNIENGLDMYIELLRMNINIVEVPLLLHLSFGKNKIKPFINLGPSIGYIMSGRFKLNQYQYDQNGIHDPTPIELKLNFNHQIEAGIIAGAGLSYKVGKGQLNIEGRYGQALTKNDFGKNIGISFLVGYSIPLKY